MPSQCTIVPAPKLLIILKMNVHGSKFHSLFKCILRRLEKAKYLKILFQYMLTHIHMLYHVLVLFCFGAIPHDTQGLPLALCSGKTPGRLMAPYVVAEIETRFYMQGKCPLPGTLLSF